MTATLNDPGADIRLAEAYERGEQVGLDLKQALIYWAKAEKILQDRGSSRENDPVLSLAWARRVSLARLLPPEDTVSAWESADR